MAKWLADQPVDRPTQRPFARPSAPDTVAAMRPAARLADARDLWLADGLTR
ncbi:hypothetical protein [Pelomonas sp. BJYL3]|uniref:hypothetical protein n=1 Tax=Pelomonas sp. BJYL3 TaxID=2976697 RepID=UPI0022B3E546|nr:hypothetical protein [Pelomonas sp. BJYL3]